MKIGKYDYNLKNIKSFIQANIRMFVEKHGLDFIGLDPHIQEQITFRESVANKECLKNGYCKCNCILPDMFYADKTCEDQCYPPMLNKKEWEEFKDKLNRLELTLDENLYKFWLKNINNMVKLEFESDLGVVEYGTLINKVIKVTSNEDYTIKSISTSCGCTKVYYDEPFSSKNGVIYVEIDTLKKRPNAQLHVSISITWSNNQISYIEFYGYNLKDGHNETDEKQKGN
jgi:hypothetical protein